MRFIRSIGFLAVALSLAACTPVTPTPTPSPSAIAESPTPSSTPSPTPVATVITINADSVVVFDQDGRSMMTLDFVERGVDTAAVLTGLFGFAPVIEVFEPYPSDARFQGTQYDWEGFSLYWSMGYEDDPSSGSGRYSNTYVEATVSSVRGMSVQSTGGARVGDAEGLGTRYPEDTRSFEIDGVTVEFAYLDCIVLSPVPDGEYTIDGAPAADCVALRADPASGPVTSIMAPAPLNYGL